MSAEPNPAQPVCSPQELRKLFLFEKLTDEQLAWLCTHGRVELFEPGPVYAEGDPATCFYVLLSGTVVMSRLVGGDDVEVGRTSSVGVYSGAFNAYLGDRVAKFKLPRTVDYAAELPRDPNGKLYKRRLRDPYWSGRDRAI